MTPAETDRLLRLLAVAADDLWPLCIGREDCGTLIGPGTGAFRLFVNVNDHFVAAADEEMVPIEDEEAVIALGRADYAPAPDAYARRDAGIIEWVAKKRGLTPPYHWRDRLKPKP